MRKNNQKQSLLEAAIQVVESRGAGNLTMDGVAAEAGVSKGGLLYHFPSKRLLLQGMLTYLIESNGDNARQGDNPVHGALLSDHGVDAKVRSASQAIIAAGAEDPALLDPAREYFRGQFDLTKQADDPELAMILLLAREGMRFLEVLNLTDMSEAKRTRLRNRLAQMAEGL